MGLMQLSPESRPIVRKISFLFLLREALNEMDVPTRQSYVMAVVRPEELSVAE